MKKIARSEKIDESREFAADIQESLAKRIQKSYKPVKDRGVRKAPFVVLIGADMPSILTEISFLSNPADEQLLKKPDHRQRVAEGLYQGVASYLQSLNSVTVNLPKLPSSQLAARRPVASVDQTRNPRNLLVSNQNCWSDALVSPHSARPLIDASSARPNLQRPATARKLDRHRADPKSCSEPRQRRPEAYGDVWIWCVPTEFAYLQHERELDEGPAYAFGDSSGAYEAFTFLRAPDMNVR